MKRGKIGYISIAALVVIISILYYNKSRNVLLSQSDILTAVPVSVHTVGKQLLKGEATLVGTIGANNDVAIVSETQGKVVSVLAEVGQVLNQGDVIIEIDDELKKAGYIAAETNFEKAKKDLERFESLFRQNSVTDQQLEGARLNLRSAEAGYLVAKRQYNDTRIKTPIAGTLTARPVDVGTYVAPGMVVSNVVDISSLRVKANVPEADAFALKIGQKLKVETDVYPGIAYEGRISSIGSKADEAHTYPVEIRMENPKNNPLRAGMFGRITYIVDQERETVAIPREALIGSVKNPRVFVVEGKTARLREIVIRGEVGNSLIVGGGLAAGETIVVNGQNNLKDSTEVAVLK